MIVPLIERFERFALPEPITGCWLWTASLRSNGYGQINEGGRSRMMLKAHRVSWTLYRGAIPDGLCVLHKCDTPPCVNPDHLFLGTQAQNVKDMHDKGRDNHPRGERHRSAKLTVAQVLEIRRLRAEGISSGELAKIFPVDESNISRIGNGHLWKSVKTVAPHK